MPDELKELFTEGTAPERDPAFALQVAAEIRRSRLRSRFLAFALREAPMLMLFVVLFAASRVIAPVLAQLLEGVPQFMGVPVPMVALGVLVAGLALCARHGLPLRRWHG
ncbi:MAG TPA: hypothetical protein PKE27_17165 [Povalibacter sp.]|mgnify:CR=1 FL=1|uniref:hypothetical protein n=1 Tax=Povalibacter sp. TaxID=1962978 RepID=UPI002BD0D92B|nr:hypothetical protein [Povalibacter sp.]HMN46311.1 hypothetical protein [Povalibacter sp.]